MKTSKFRNLWHVLTYAMKSCIIGLALAVVSTQTAWADPVAPTHAKTWNVGEKIPDLKTLSGKTYRNVTVSDITPSEIRIMHESGAARIQMEDLSADLKAKFGYDPEKAKAHERAEAEKEKAKAEAIAKARERAEAAKAAKAEAAKAAEAEAAKAAKAEAAKAAEAEAAKAAKAEAAKAAEEKQALQPKMKGAVLEVIQSHEGGALCKVAYFQRLKIPDSQLDSTGHRMTESTVGERGMLFGDLGMLSERFVFVEGVSGVVDGAHLQAVLIDNGEVYVYSTVMGSRATVPKLRVVDKPNLYKGPIYREGDVGPRASSLGSVGGG